MTVRRCANCVFWELAMGHQGPCRRHAPRSTLVRKERWDEGDIPDVVCWPIVNAYDWCGEFQPEPPNEPSDTPR